MTYFHIWETSSNKYVFGDEFIFQYKSMVPNFLTHIETLPWNRDWLTFSNSTEQGLHTHLYFALFEKVLYFWLANLNSPLLVLVISPFIHHYYSNHRLVIHKIDIGQRQTRDLSLYKCHINMIYKTVSFILVFFN